MKVLATSLALVLSAICMAPAPARAVDLIRHGAPSVPANRIVGLWSTLGGVRPCGSTLPLNPVRNMVLFQAGGTVLANPQAAPAAGFANLIGIPGNHQRGQDLGTWAYNPLTRQYTARLFFDWYVDGVYHGYQRVDRTILLSNDGNTASGPVRTTRYNTAGAIIGTLCGDVVSTRL